MDLNHEAADRMCHADRVLQLQSHALSLGLSDTKFMTIDQIEIDAKLRKLCEQPRCPNYATSANCPPHAMTPEKFRIHLRRYSHALAFKFDMPNEALREENHPEASRLLHETTASIEHQAKILGFAHARGYSSGGCKKTLCAKHNTCAVLEKNRHCRHPDIARPSLSGMGVNWHKLSKHLGWNLMKDESGRSLQESATFMMAGLVLLDLTHPAF